VQADQQAEAASSYTIELHMEDIYEEMIDGEVLFAHAFRDPLTRLIRPALYVTQGSSVLIKLVNKTSKPRRFALTGMPDDRFPIIQPGRYYTIGFQASHAGSYIYHENSQGAAGRVAGFYGAFIVMPRNGKTAQGAETPYEAPTAAQSALFDALGTAPAFPGEGWRPDLPERTRCWVFSEVFPDLNRALERNEQVTLNTLLYQFRAKYFTMNSLSGYDSAHDPSCFPSGYQGEPTLLRTMNVGLCTHGPHIHGNHVYGVAESTPAGKVQKCHNVLEFDTWMLKPMWRKDVLLPFVKPDEIPNEIWPPREEAFPLYYPMHCHIEMSQTAGGGNYPQGMVTHWELLGPTRGA
jgi:hypothetical protein